jgi:hypothetical protein
VLHAGGQVDEGLDVPCGGPGVLRIVQGTGPMLTWLDEPGHEGAVLWSGAGGSEVKLGVPAVVALGSAAATFEIAATPPAVVSVRAAVPAVARVSTTGQASEITAHPAGVRLDVVSLAGGLKLGLRGLGGRELNGDLEVTATPIESIGEGLGPAVLLPPGGARGFAFTLPEARQVGMGVRAAGPGVEAALYDSAGQQLGSGVVLMRRLEAGKYVLLLTNPEGGEPVVARPAVAGLELPGSGPPEEVIRHYLKLAKGELDEEGEGETPRWRQPHRPSGEEQGEEEGEPESEGSETPDTGGN